MQQFIVAVHLMVAFLIIGLILTQRGKGADMGTGFGAGASQTVFGSRGSTSFLVKLIAILVAMFFISTVALNYFFAANIKEEKLANTPQVLLPDKQSNKTQ